MPRLFHLLIVLYLIGIVFVHAIPTGDRVSLSGIDVAASFRASDLVHVVVFLPWGIFGAWWVHRSRGRRLLRAMGWIFAGLVVAAGAEGIQYWLPYRSFNGSDMAFNMAGVAVGSLVLLIPWPGNGRRSRAYDEQGRSGR